MSPRGRPSRLERVRLLMPAEGPARVALLSDTHSAPHPHLITLISELAPVVALHAGDVGQERVISQVEAVCPVVAVRGNVDGYARPDHLHIQLLRHGEVALELLLTHVGLYGARLLPQVRALAKELGVSLVVCGHSHVPFLGKDGPVVVFNPGSCGPRRWTLPVTMGLLELGPAGASLRHLDCDTGLSWEPPA